MDDLSKNESINKYKQSPIDVETRTSNGLSGDIISELEKVINDANSGDKTKDCNNFSDLTNSDNSKQNERMEVTETDCEPMDVDEEVESWNVFPDEAQNIEGKNTKVTEVDNSDENLDKDKIPIDEDLEFEEPDSKVALGKDRVNLQSETVGNVERDTTASEIIDEVESVEESQEKAQSEVDTDQNKETEDQLYKQIPEETFNNKEVPELNEEVKNQELENIEDNDIGNENNESITNKSQSNLEETVNKSEENVQTMAAEKEEVEESLMGRESDEDDSINKEKLLLSEQVEVETKNNEENKSFKIITDNEYSEQESDDFNNEKISEDEKTEKATDMEEENNREMDDEKFIEAADDLEKDSKIIKEGDSEIEEPLEIATERTGSVKKDTEMLAEEDDKVEKDSEMIAEKDDKVENDSEMTFGDDKLEKDSEMIAEEDDKVEKDSEMTLGDDKVEKDLEMIAEEDYKVVKGSEEDDKDSEMIAEEDDKVEKDSEVIAEEHDIVEKDLKMVAKENDHVENDSEMTLGDDKVEKDSEIIDENYLIEKDSEIITKEDDKSEKDLQIVTESDVVEKDLEIPTEKEVIENDKEILKERDDSEIIPKEDCAIEGDLKVSTKKDQQIEKHLDIITEQDDDDDQIAKNDEKERKDSEIEEILESDSETLTGDDQGGKHLELLPVIGDDEEIGKQKEKSLEKNESSPNEEVEELGETSVLDTNKEKNEEYAETDVAELEKKERKENLKEKNKHVIENLENQKNDFLKIKIRSSSEMEEKVKKIVEVIEDSEMEILEVSAKTINEKMITDEERNENNSLEDVSKNEKNVEKDIEIIGNDSDMPLDEEEANSKKLNEEEDVDMEVQPKDLVDVRKEKETEENVEDTEIDSHEETTQTEIVDICEEEEHDAHDSHEVLEDPIFGKDTEDKDKEEKKSDKEEDDDENLECTDKINELNEKETSKEELETDENELITGDTGSRVPDENKELEKSLTLAERLNMTEKSNDSSRSSEPTTDGGRPKRNAAKQAVNKIKSLVRNDLVAVEDDVDDDPEVDIVVIYCHFCSKSIGNCKLALKCQDQVKNFCSQICFDSYRQESQPGDSSAQRLCSFCRGTINTSEYKNISWETMDYCNEQCLERYQEKLVSNCALCRLTVPQSSMGKYCVRFGCEIKQFCKTSCLDEYKKGLKVCSYCQKDISKGGDGFLAPVGDKGQFKDFCTQSCMEKYEKMSSSNIPKPDVIEKCAVCSEEKQVQIEIQLENNQIQKLCSDPCFASFKFVNKVAIGHCDMCKNYFDKLNTVNFTIYSEDNVHSFCCKTCMNVYILANRKIVPCGWCKVKKYNFDMIRRQLSSETAVMVCSLNCLNCYMASSFIKTVKHIKCDGCFNQAPVQYRLAMSDGSGRNFCSYSCTIAFQNKFNKTIKLSGPMPIGGPKKIVRSVQESASPSTPLISSVQSLSTQSPITTIPISEVNLVKQSTPAPITISAPIQPPPQPQIFQQIITKPAPVKEMKNKSTICKPYTHSKGVSCRPHPCVKETQTDESLSRKCLIPVPVPIFIPAPLHMFSLPFPVAVPFPLPVPVPIFIPTTRNSAKGIFKEIKKIQEKIPTDPFEAELLMMAEMVAGDKKQDPTDSESEEGNDAEEAPETTFSPEPVDTSTPFGEDIMQMALKMASELDEPAVDMESVLPSASITPTSQPHPQPVVDPNKNLYQPEEADQSPVMQMARGRKRGLPRSSSRSPAVQNKRGRRSSNTVDVPLLPPPEPLTPARIQVEKPDENMCLKYTFGVNAWRHWVLQKNAELEKAAMNNRKIKPFKPDLLQLTADELNFSLCMFVKEVKKPTGVEYAPDTVYYLCLGIQQYLFENGRIDNIFTDTYYEKFTDCLDDVAKKFTAIYNDQQFIITRVEEEHLWESKQLGAHSPHVLLSTLMFFNTKHFNLTTVEEHMQLSFSHIMKHWKRNPNSPGVAKVPGSRNVLLRFYPPQSALEANSRKKKVYEQQENEENPLRCPVKLYEFYLSKCPESVKTRNDVFYLLPERSCVPDSPVWYSTMALGKEPLQKMLNRVKMVKEINIALLNS